MSKIIIIGGSGFIGSALISDLTAQKHRVIVLSRKITSKLSDESNCLEGSKKERDSLVTWAPYPKSGESFPKELFEDVDCLIHLAGESIAGLRWTKAKKQRILESRLQSIRTLQNALRRQGLKLPLWIQASATGYYGYSNHANALDEDAAAGEGFLAQVCKGLEQELMTGEAVAERVVFARFGIVLGDGGFLKQAEKSFLPLLSIQMGKGEQWLPWIHLDDVSGGILHILGQPTITGPVNFVAPHSVLYKDFVAEMMVYKGSRANIMLPEFFAEILLGEMSELMLKGIRVQPKKLLQHGYRFCYADIGAALQSLHKR